MRWPASRRTLQDAMEQQENTAAGTPEAEVTPPVRRGGVRLWTLRVFVLTLLLAAAATVTAAAVTIVRGEGKAAGRHPGVYGVIMPDATAYQRTVGALLARKRPLELKGLTVVGDSGKVTVLRAKRKAATTFPSAYLNAGALSLIARAVGVRSDSVITVQELRLEKLRSTGRLRWRLRGEQAGRSWRAVIAPNGTELKLLPTTTS
jgi:hypothetical protein